MREWEEAKGDPEFIGYSHFYANMLNKQQQNY